MHNSNLSEWDGKIGKIVLQKMLSSDEMISEVQIFDLDAKEQDHSYSVYWTLSMKVVDEKEHHLKMRKSLFVIAAILL
jgi:hypothetical protein